LAFEPKGVGTRIMGKRFLGATSVVHRLAKREVEMEAVHIAEAGRRQRLLHGLDVGLVELDGFQVRQAPPRLAERRSDRERLAIRGDAFSLAADRLEHVAVAEPHAGLPRRLSKQALV